MRPAHLALSPAPLAVSSLTLSLHVRSGKKFISLAISEPQAGSDVQGITTTAKLSEDGKHWIVSGMKKWITKGVLVLLFVLAVNRRRLLVASSRPRRLRIVEREETSVGGARTG